MASAPLPGGGPEAVPTPSGLGPGGSSGPGAITPGTLAARAPAAQHESAQQAVEQALAALDGVERAPLGEHVARFDQVHTALSEALSTIDRV